MLTLLVLVYGLIQLSKSLQEYSYLRYKTKSYLCVKRTIKIIDNYYRVMQSLTIAIRTAYYGQFVIIPPQVSSSAKSLRKTLMAAQYIYHFSFMKNVASNNKCSLKNTIKIVIKPPVKIKQLALFKKDFSGAAILESNWKTQLVFIPPRGLSKLKESFVVELVLEKESSFFSSMFKLKTRELGYKAMLSSNSWVGPQ